MATLKEILNNNSIDQTAADIDEIELLDLQKYLNYGFFGLAATQANIILNRMEKYKKQIPGYYFDIWETLLEIYRDMATELEVHEKLKRGMSENEN